MFPKQWGANLQVSAYQVEVLLLLEPRFGFVYDAAEVSPFVATMLTKHP